MDLEEVKANKERRDSGSEHFKMYQAKYAAEMKKAIIDAMPAASDFDQAAAAWHIAGTIAALMRVEAADLSDALYWTTVAYARATTELLGWENDDLGN